MFVTGAIAVAAGVTTWATAWVAGASRPPLNPPAMFVTGAIALAAGVRTWATAWVAGASRPPAGPLVPELLPPEPLVGPDLSEEVALLIAAWVVLTVESDEVVTLPEPTAGAGLVGPDLSELVLPVMRLVVVLPGRVEALAVLANSAQEKTSAKVILQVK
jgi:hypothetical protein